MKETVFERKQKERTPVLAICYDFDKTLSPDDMQAQGYIQSVGFDISRFWAETNELAETNDMDHNLAYMFKMIHEAKGRLIPNKETLKRYGANVELFAGVKEWFDRITEYGDIHGVTIEHYIISSGLKEMIEGTAIADKFEKIYASSFYYDDRGVPVWPAQVVNYTNKTQFLFRIEKGTLDVNDPGVNEFFSPEEIRVPFRNMIYIGDSDTDVPCMKLVNANGGHAIGVYNAQTSDKAKVYKMMRDGRIKYYVPADYSEDTPLDLLVKSIIDRTAANEALEEFHYRCEKECREEDKITDKEEQKKWDLILALEISESFAATHTIMQNLLLHTEWSPDATSRLFAIACNNSQVRLILRDQDVRRFYKMLLEHADPADPNAKTVKEIIEKNKNP